MANAVNRLIDLQGGIVVSKEGRIVYELAMPVYSLLSEAPMEEIARRTMELDGAMAAIGVTMEKPFLALQTIPFTGLPFLRITDKGLADIKNKRLVPLLLLDGYWGSAPPPRQSRMEPPRSARPCFIAAWGSAAPSAKDCSYTRFDIPPYPSVMHVASPYLSRHMIAFAGTH